MDPTSFKGWLGGIASLTDPQRRSAWQVLALFEAGACPGAEALAALDQTPAHVGQALDQVQPAGLSAQPSAAEQMNPVNVADLGQSRVDSVGCPHCFTRDVVRWGRASDLPRYRCKACLRTFNALTKTPLANLRMKDKWTAQTEAMIDGVSLAKAARRCGVHPSTAFRWRHRFLAALSGDKPKALSGIVEGDETFILESFKGKRSGLPRKSRKRGGKSAEQLPVIVARDRVGATTDAILPKLDRVSIAAALGGVAPANEFCCDGGTAIVAFARRAGIAAHILPNPPSRARSPGKPTRQAPNYHLNNVNAYHGRLKEWLRRFHGVATKNLPNYLGWRRALEALGGHATPARMILGALGMGPYQQMTL
jgi:transposase-like protein